MGDNNFQQMFQEQTSHDFNRRASSMMDPRQQHCMESMAAMQRYQNPVTMWQQAQTQQPNLDAMSMLQQTQNHQPNPAFPMMLQSNGQRFYQPSMKMFQALQQNQGSQLYHATIACSKRFSEEEKQKLEKVFTDETQKPSTSRKRQLAEELGCPVPKVNVCSWSPPFRLYANTRCPRTGSKIGEPERSRCTGSRHTRPARQLIRQLRRPTWLNLRRTTASMLTAASSTA